MIIKEFGKFKKVYEGWYSEEEEAVALDSIAAEAEAGSETAENTEEVEADEDAEVDHIAELKASISELKEKLADNEEALEIVGKIETSLAAHEAEEGEGDEDESDEDGEGESEESDDTEKLEAEGEEKKEETEEEELEETNFGKALDYEGTEEECEEIA